MNGFLASNIGEDSTIKQLLLNGNKFYPKTTANAVYFADGETLSEKWIFISSLEIEQAINDIFNN